MVKSVYELFKQSLNYFLKDRCFGMSAAIAYYAVFSLPGLLYVALFVAGFMLERAYIMQELSRQVDAFFGAESGELVMNLLQQINMQPTTLSFFGGIGIIGMLYGATGVFTQLQTSLNVIWNAEPDLKQDGIFRFARKRTLSFLMILATGSLLLLSMLFSTVLTGFGEQMNIVFPELWSVGIIQVMHYSLSFVVILLLIALIYKVLPDVDITWRDVGFGATVTAVGFVIGREIIGSYLGRSSMRSVFGSASSLAIFLLWIHYSAILLLWGAELTQVKARRRKRIFPKR